VIAVRNARSEDIPFVYKTEIECFHDPWSEKSLNDLLESENACFLCAAAVNDDGTEELIGYGSFYYTLDEAFINNIAVSPLHRRCGAGSAVVKGLISEARKRNITAVHLEVRESNTPAIGLYSSLGFSVMGTRKNFYPPYGDMPRENALLMSIFLTE